MVRLVSFSAFCVIIHEQLQGTPERRQYASSRLHDLYQTRKLLTNMPPNMWKLQLALLSIKTRPLCYFSLTPTPTMRQYKYGFHESLSCTKFIAVQRPENVSYFKGRSTTSICNVKLIILFCNIILTNQYIWKTRKQNPHIIESSDSKKQFKWRSYICSHNSRRSFANSENRPRRLMNEIFTVPVITQFETFQR